MPYGCCRERWINWSRECILIRAGVRCAGRGSTYATGLTAGLECAAEYNRLFGVSGRIVGGGVMQILEVDMEHINAAEEACI